MKKHTVIILDHNRGQLANQLWSYMSVYAYCLERGYEIRNPSFGDYRRYFSLAQSEPLVDALFFNRFKKSRLYAAVRPYHRWVQIIKKLRKDSLLASGGPDDHIVHLPPTDPDADFVQKIRMLEEHAPARLYFCGGRFRNPIGIEKYRKEIREYLRPAAPIERSVQEKLKQMRTAFAHVVGVHIRQTDFKTDNKGHYVPPQAFRDALAGFLRLRDWSVSETLFLICSDEEVDPAIFDGFNTVLNKGNLAEDMFALAGTDALIGSNSTFGAFAAYYGNIPMVVVDNSPIDWDYYRGTESYFENKYCTLVKY